MLNTQNHFRKFETAALLVCKGAKGRDETEFVACEYRCMVMIGFDAM